MPIRNQKKKWQPTLLEPSRDSYNYGRRPLPSQRRDLGGNRNQNLYARRGQYDAPYDEYEDDLCESIVAACCCCWGEIRDFLMCSHSPTSY
eukprot:1881708-Rhodomonas_salina.1